MAANPTDQSFTDAPAADRFKAYLAHQFQAGRDKACLATAGPGGHAITISHQTGAGAHEIGKRLVALMQAGETGPRAPWTLFDRHLFERMLEDHHLPKALAEFLPEDGRSYLRDALDDLFGVIPPSWEVVPKLTETVLQMVQAGHVILVGRGASFITAGLPRVFHVHLVAPLAARIERIRSVNHLSDVEAAAFVREKDKARERYVKANFSVGIDDDLLYHLVINTERIPWIQAAILIAREARNTFERDTKGSRETS